MQTTSFFHAAYEALLVNELRYLQLIEHKVGSYHSPSSKTRPKLIGIANIVWSGYSSAFRNNLIILRVSCPSILVA